MTKPFALNKLSKSALLTALLLPSAALAQIGVGDTVGTSEEAVRAALEAKGYQIEEIENEDGAFEIETILDGRAYEIEVSVENGIVTEIELEDENDSKDG